MSNIEEKVLNSICVTKDIQAVLSTDSEKFFIRFEDVWQYLKEYYARYRAVPAAEILSEKFDHFNVIPVKGETEYLVNELREEYVTAQLSEITIKMRDHLKKGTAGQFILQNLVREAMELSNQASRAKDLDITDIDLAKEHYDETRRLAELNGGVPGILTGIDFIDAAYQSGLNAGDLIVVLGYTGRMKSFITTYIACQAYLNSKKPMIVSLEMSTEKVRDRIYTILGNGAFKNNELASGIVDEVALKSFASSKLKDNGFVVMADSGEAEVTPALIQGKINQYKPDIIILDYAQLMSDNGNSGDMVGRMRNMSKELKRLAVANEIPIILISSATPDSGANMNSAPQIHNVGWSKQLAYDCDLAFAVHKHDILLDDGSAVIEIAGRKNRNGDLFSGYLKGNVNEGIYESFYDLETLMGSDGVTVSHVDD